MKTITCVSHFKKVSDKDSVNYGVKRESLEWSFDGLDSQDLANAVESGNTGWLEKVALICNAKLEDFGRSLVLKNNDDWSFCPSSAEINIDSVFTDLTSTVSRKRKVTKESLETCAAFYTRYAVQLLGKDSKQAAAGGKVIESKLQLIAANTAALNVIAQNLSDLLDKIAEFMDSEDISQDAKDSLEIEFTQNAEVIEWLITGCQNLISLSEENLADSL